MQIQIDRNKKDNAKISNFYYDLPIEIGNIKQNKDCILIGGGNDETFSAQILEVLALDYYFEEQNEEKNEEEKI